MRILHIIRNPKDATAIEIAESQSHAHEVKILLMHDAVYSKTELPACACEADARARGVTWHECVNYAGIVKMLFDYDRVISW